LRQREVGVFEIALQAYPEQIAFQPADQEELLESMGLGGRCVVSEPLTDLESLWEPVAESSFITISGS
jgi:predicted glutamine amidotransferase